MVLLRLTQRRANSNIEARLSKAYFVACSSPNYYAPDGIDCLSRHDKSRALGAQEQMCIGNDSFGSPFC